MECDRWLDVGGGILLCLRELGHEGEHVASPEDHADLATYRWDECSGVVTVETPEREAH